jgi:RHS repeat-associated protein
LIKNYHFQNGIDNPITGDTRTDFVYDGLMRLRQRLEYSFTCTGGGGGDQASAQLAGEGAGTPTNCLSSLPIETDYIYDGMRVIQERVMGVPTVSYTRGNDLSASMGGAGGIGGLLARSSGYSGGNWTNHNFYFADGNGNVTYMLNSSQALVASYRYDPFGNTISASGTLASANVYRFSSKEIHANSGMYYYGYRFYDPNLQMWINRDPLTEFGFETGQTLGQELPPDLTGILLKLERSNLYQMVSNDPANKTDKLGLIFWPHLPPFVVPPGTAPDVVGPIWQRFRTCRARCKADRDKEHNDCTQYAWCPDSTVPRDFVAWSACMVGVNMNYDACVKLCFVGAVMWR